MAGESSKVSKGEPLRAVFARNKPTAAVSVMGCR